MPAIVISIVNDAAARSAASLWLGAASSEPPSVADTASGVMTITGAATTSAGSYVIASDGTVSEMVSGPAR